MNTSLPTDSDERKKYPLYSALFGYFGAALAGVAHHSWHSNEKHNPGQPVHWSIDKSTDHADCIARHLLDLGDMLADKEKGGDTTTTREVLAEADALAWRALALNQTLRMRFANAPLPFNARKTTVEDVIRWGDFKGAIDLRDPPLPEGCTVLPVKHRDIDDLPGSVR